MSVIPYEEYAPHIRRSVIEAIREYEVRHGRKPAVIFAGYKAHAAMVCGQNIELTPEGFLFVNIPLKLSPEEEYTVRLAGDPVKIRLTKQYK